MDQNRFYGDIASRCGGDIYIGVAGPVRTGKSSFIKRFMELMVLPNMEDDGARERSRDELPQSGSGRMVTTVQPAFVPNEAVDLRLKDNTNARVRLIDCVGYLVPGAVGAQDGEAPRMVRTPWSDEEIPFEQAAEIGTRKVIEEHSTVGVVVTTDGSVAALPREAYEDAEKRTVDELKSLGKPFVIVLNTTDPTAAKPLAEKLEAQYAVPVLAENVQQMSEADIAALMEKLLFEFPIRELRVRAPRWLTALDGEHWLGASVEESLRTAVERMEKMGDYPAAAEAFSRNEHTEEARVGEVNLNEGSVEMSIGLKEGLFYKILGEACGCEIEGDEHLFELMQELVRKSRAYARIEPALASVEETGYGVVLPEIDELDLKEPEIARDGGHFGVRLRANAPSLHLIRVDLDTNVSPIVGTEKQSQELVQNLADAYRNDPSEVWATEVFGKPLRDLVRDEMSVKLNHLPDDAREKIRASMGKIINEGTGGMICILL